MDFHRRGVVSIPTRCHLNQIIIDAVEVDKYLGRPKVMLSDTWVDFGIW